MFTKISNDDYNKMLVRIGKAYLPPEPKKRKPTLIKFKKTNKE